MLQWVILFPPPNNCFFQFTDAVEFLIHSYPKFVTVGSLPCDSTEDRVGYFVSKCIQVIVKELLLLKIHFSLQIALAELLFEKGIIHTSEPL